jgi:uncharacterized damage-inducible protein DinB
MTIAALLLEDFEHEMENTRKMLERVPDDKLGWAPHPKSMTLSRLVGHVAEMPNWATVTLQQDELVLQPGQLPLLASSRSEVLEKFNQYVEDASRALKAATEEQMMRTWTLKSGTQVIFSMPRQQVLRSVVLDHMIHHRGQISVYLRLLDVAIPGMYGPSADEMAMPQKSAVGN